MSLFDKRHLVFPVDVLSGCNTLVPVVALHVVNSYPVTNVPNGMEITILVMGCFWSVERLFWQSPSAYNTVAGCTGGYTPDPAYREVCSGDAGHVETVRIVCDSFVIGYERLLQVFWENHDPAQGVCQDNDHGTQYCLTIYPLTSEQDTIVCASLERLQAVILTADDDRRITTEIANAIPFHYVEDDHQRYLHKNPYGHYGIGGVGICLPPET